MVAKRQSQTDRDPKPKIVKIKRVGPSKRYALHMQRGPRERERGRREKTANKINNKEGSICLAGQVKVYTASYENRREEQRIAYNLMRIAERGASRKVDFSGNLVYSCN